MFFLESIFRLFCNRKICSLPLRALTLDQFDACAVVYIDKSHGPMRRRHLQERRASCKRRQQRKPHNSNLFNCLSN